MRDDVKNLIAKIEGEDPSARENAILDLMYRMEDSTRHMAKSDVFDDKYFSLDEQIELIDVLLELAESLREEYAPLLFVVSKATPIVMIEPVQEFVLKYAETMPNHMLHQSLVALENCMVTEEFRDYEAIQQKYKYKELTTLLRRIELRIDMVHRVLKDTLLNMEVFHNE